MLKSGQPEMTITGVRQFLEQIMAPTYAARLTSYILISAAMPPRGVAYRLPVTEIGRVGAGDASCALVCPNDVDRLLVRSRARIGTTA